jgi:hypothetical protein
MPITRGNPQKNYKLINEFGLDYAEDVSDISDSTSGIFDDEIKGETINMLRERVRNLHIGKGIRVAGSNSEIFATCVVEWTAINIKEKVYECSDIT